MSSEQESVRARTQICGIPPQYPPIMSPPSYNQWMNGPPPQPGQWPTQWPTQWQGEKFPSINQWMIPSGENPMTSGTKNAQNEYMVDSMRSIYGNENSSIEIERVKVQRRQPGPNMSFSGLPRPPYITNPSNAIVSTTRPELPPVRRPPPRKHRKNKLNNEVMQANAPNNSYPYPCYPPPFMPYAPYPYPYPYPCFNYMWPPQTQSWHPDNNPWQNSSSNEVKNIEHANEQHISQQAMPDSLGIKSGTPTRDSMSPEIGRPFSPNAPSQISQITESQSTDIGPSDSVSVGGYRKGGSSGTKSTDWIIDAQISMENREDSSEHGDKISFTTAPSDIPSPPSRRSKKKVNSMNSKSENNDDDEVQSIISDKSSSDLNDAFRSLEISVDIFKSQVSVDAPENETTTAPVKTDEERNISRGGRTENEIGIKIVNRERQSSSSSFHSIKLSSDIMVETDSTDIIIATDTATADEEPHSKRRAPPPPFTDEGTCGRDEAMSPAGPRDEEPMESSKWVLQGPGEAPDVAMQQGGNTWLADVSVWRARLVVSLDRGQGLDQQDWSTFHLLIQHPLPLRLKLSLLHAPRICTANTDVGAVSVRTALLQLARHAQVLLQGEENRPSGWKSITAHHSQPWMPVKGGIDILHILGYRRRDDGTLRYSRRQALDSSRLARLTLDLLIFADELRLYLTGTHEQPTTISDLFCPISFSPSVTPEPLGMRMNVELNASFGSSADFISAESTPVMKRKWENTQTEKSHFESETGKFDYNKQLLEQYSSSEEDITLHEDQIDKDNSSNSGINIKSLENENTFNHNQCTSVTPSSGIQSTDMSERRSMSTDITSLPDLQSMSSLPPSRMSNLTKSGVPSDFSNVNSPVTSPVPPMEEKEVKIQNEGKKEDHIYEEIGEIRMQVQKLRSSVSVPNLPPPLPPKIRSQTTYQDEDNSMAYSKGEWSTVSSMGGSTGRRRKKRRAPLPPSFLYEDQIRERNRLEEIPSEAVELDYPDRSFEVIESVSGNGEKITNPFYEEIGDAKPKASDDRNNVGKTENASVNPFYGSKPKPTGFIGANPFYEDISVLRKSLLKQESKSESISDHSSASILNTSSDVQFDQSDGNTPPVAATRPKRKAPKPPKEENSSTASLPSNKINMQNEEKQRIEKSSPEFHINNIPSNELENVSDSLLQDDQKDLDISISNKSQYDGFVAPLDSELHDINLQSSEEESLANCEVVKAEISAMEKFPKNEVKKQLLSSQDVASVDQTSQESMETTNTSLQSEGKKNIRNSCDLIANSENVLTIVKVNEQVSQVETISEDIKHDPIELTSNLAEVENQLDAPQMHDEKSNLPKACNQILGICSASSDIEESPSGSDATTVISNVPIKQIANSEKIVRETTSEDSVKTAESETNLSQNVNNVVDTSDIDAVTYDICKEDNVVKQLVINDMNKNTKIDESEVHNTSVNIVESNSLQHTNTIIIDSTNDSEMKDNTDKDSASVNKHSTQSKRVESNASIEISRFKYDTDNFSIPPTLNEKRIDYEIPYIDNTDVKNYKETMQNISVAKKRDAIPPIVFLSNSMPYIDDSILPYDLEPPPLPPSPPPAETPPLISPPETPHASPPSTPPLVADEDMHSSQELENKRLSKISENTELGDGKSEKVDNENEDFKATIVFGNVNIVTNLDKRATCSYYEILEMQEIPPPLPAKPGNQRNSSLLQKTPELPPKSPRLTSPKIVTPLPMTEDDRYEIPDVTRANAQAVQIKSANASNDDGASISMATHQDSIGEDSTNPFAPPRRRRHSSHYSPCKSSKTFSSQFPGLTTPSHSAGNRSPSPSPSRAETLPHPKKTNTKPHQLPSSTPSTPRPLPRAKLNRSKTDKSRKSWPYLFCDCIYANYESTNYNK